MIRRILQRRPNRATDRIKLIVGLGNPGRQYAENRHNIGFQVLDRLAARYQLPFDKIEFQGLLARGEVAAETVLLLKPLTYMNRCGEAVKPVQGRYDVRTEDLLVIYDDLDLPVGNIRVRERGSSGGHKGMESIIASLGTQNIARVRVGIGRPDGEPPEEYVLRDFSLDESIIVEEARERAIAAVVSFVREGIAETMNKCN